MTGLLALDPLGPERWGARIPPTMAQGRSAFGGFVVGLAMRAVEGIVGPDRPPRSIAVGFVAPVAPGSVELGARVLRAGRALTQVEVRVEQEGVTALVALFACGAARPTGLAWPGPRAPELPDPATHVPLGYLEGITPAFTQHFEHRWTRGGLPFSGAPGPGFGGLIRPLVGEVDAAVIPALLDGWPCPVLPLADRVVPASTVTWLVNFVRETPRASTGSWWRFETAAVASAEGYVDVDSQLWAPDGELVATSRQLVAEFSPPGRPWRLPGA